MKKCNWLRHNWGKWEDKFEGKTTHAQSYRNRPILIQERRCKDCSEAERKTVTV